jgi:hypothetical protein
VMKMIISPFVCGTSSRRRCSTNHGADTFLVIQQSISLVCAFPPLNTDCCLKQCPSVSSRWSGSWTTWIGRGCEGASPNISFEDTEDEPRVKMATT